jgi:hypothetical protein
LHTPHHTTAIQPSHLLYPHAHYQTPLQHTSPNLARTTSNSSCLLSSPLTPSHSHNRPRNKFPSPFPGHPHQITPSLPYPYPFHLHPFSEQAIIGENGGKRANRTSLEISVSRVYVSAFVFYCVIHPLLTTCRAHEEGGGGRKKDPPPSSSKLFKNSHKPLLTTLFLPKCNPGPLPTFPSSPHGRVCRSR